MSDSENLATMQAGDRHYKAYVGPPLKYDLVGAMQFNLLTSIGLRDRHTLLDIGCGSLRAGKLLLPFLQAEKYFGIEPNQWLIDEGIKNEVGEDLIQLKKPKFNNSKSFEMGSFGQVFDFMIAQSIFSHASVEQIQQCLTEAKKNLAANGFFLATFVLGDENYTGSEWVYPGCVTYTNGFICQLAREKGFVALKSEWLHPNDQTWYILVHPENEEEARNRLTQLFKVNKAVPKKKPKKHWHYTWWGRVYRKIRWVTGI